MKKGSTPFLLLLLPEILLKKKSLEIIFPFILLVLLSTKILAQSDTTTYIVNTKKNLHQNPIGAAVTPNIVQGCNIIGPGTVTAGTTYVYTLNCSDGSTAFSWDVLCGTATYWDGTEIDIIWNSSGCTSGKVTAKRSNGSMLATKTVIINPAPPPSITYTSLYNSSNFVKTIDLTKPVGTIPGLASTTATGGVSYTIPLDLPVGTNGIKPNISLQYNSQGGSGIVGFGWNISGLSAIGRMGKDIYFNGIVAPVTYTSDDAFQLDGMRLSPVSGSNGANGTIYAGETETFSQIISYTSNSPNNPDWFKVIAKDGSAMEFGHNTTDSRILTDNSANVMLWRLNRIQDINGNYIDFVYDNTGRDSRISTIKYTGNSNAGLAPYNSITFNYKLRSDKNIYYDAGASLYSKYLLDQIKVIADQLPPLTISQNQQIITYTPFLKTNSVTEGTYEIDYTYGADYQRMKSILKQNNSIIETKYYLGNYEKQISGGVTREIHYVSGGNGLCAIIERENGVNNFYFVYTDHLGSILTVTNSSGTVAAEQNFDAWGRNRNPSNWQYASVPSMPVWLYRGYTGHEHLPSFGGAGGGFSLINMNGRMYDPIQGRMLSPDNYVPNPFSSQGYNRYAYAGNNPLIYIDPDGNWFGIDDLIAAGLGAIINLGSQLISGNVHSLGDAFGYFITGALSGEATLYGGPVAGGAVLGLGNNLTAQFSNGASFGTLNWRSLVTSTTIGAISSYAGAQLSGAVAPYVSSWFGSVSSPVLQRALTGGVTGFITGGALGGIMSTMNGGSFWNGFGNGAAIGFSGGAIGGGINGYKYAKQNELDPWTGKPINQDVIQYINGTSLQIWNSKLKDGIYITKEDLVKVKGAYVVGENYSWRDIARILTSGTMINPNTGQPIITPSPGQPLILYSGDAVYTFYVRTYNSQVGLYLNWPGVPNVIYKFQFNK